VTDIAGRAAKSAAGVLLASTALLAAGAPAIAPHDANRQYRDLEFAPPARIRVVDGDGRWRRPFIHPLRLRSRLERRYEEDVTRRVELRWLTSGRVVQSADEAAAPLFLLGTDSLGRDLFARLVLGTRVSLGLALAAALGALLVGTAVGATAGIAAERVDGALMRLAEFVQALPSIYVILALRAALPLAVGSSTAFWLMTTVLAAVGWPVIARGVRAVVRSERGKEYAVSAVSIGATRQRLVLRHLLPACYGYLGAQATLLLPAFILAEATLSFVGLGFPEPTATLGTMLSEASNVRVMTRFPWILSPGLVIVANVLAVNLLVNDAGDRPGSPDRLA
jgi:peptide/nickel transport system permease protein